MNLDSTKINLLANKTLVVVCFETAPSFLCCKVVLLQTLPGIRFFNEKKYSSMFDRQHIAHLL